MNAFRDKVSSSRAPRLSVHYLPARHLWEGRRVLLLGFALLMGVALQGCSSLAPRLQEPTVNITSLELMESQGLAQRFRIGLLVTNPNSQALPITGMNYSLSLNGYDLIKGASNQLPTLAAYAETPVTIEATADLFAALRLLNALANEPEQSLRYQFGANMDLQGWRPMVNIKKQGVIELQ